MRPKTTPVDERASEKYPEMIDYLINHKIEIYGERDACNAESSMKLYKQLYGFSTRL
jgi:hypothetical protein